MTPERVVTPTRLPYWFEPVPERRLTLFARVCGATVLWMLWGMDTWAASHATAPRSLWAPVALARWISQPAPGTITLTVLRIVLTLAAACLVLLPDRLGRPRRWAAAVAAPTWLLWITWAFS